MYSNYQRTIKENKLRVVPEDVSDRYNESAEHFDSDVGTIEWMMGLLKMRKKLAKEAEGDVLEVSVGTGRNIEYYSLDKCKSITMVDLSPEMVEIARKKFKEAHPRYSNVTFRTQSAMVPIDAPSPQGFDTIIQTMGLCSTPEPVKLLDNLGRLANQEHGRILLLEHGKSYYTKLNEIMDNLAPAHADKHGCWWNRDIGAIIAESGLEVVSIDRYHFGTTWKVELRPRQTTLKSDTKDKGSK
ncbi:ubiquinone/menaquinone biosynthesis-related protein [Xylona heveae TC161]|uniref:Ubiquinone/menaquinone biosynthesis-related protein n=1 Tax=Xylona heveae (strain CBS 132557 / TC161) TaxID=1328760 RepID=A0A165GR13_XYLHT|nr:ubiquinone/menaquinone biosynthesis-related protein [Xylona heveae TC161]KZF22487.1 ubiquinone/menaquinone biosynthesis-related protein [Xylona heveae TC161]